MSGELSGRTSQIVLLVIGVALLAFAAWQAWRTIDFRRQAVATTATVVADRGDAPSGMSEDHPLIEFATADGTTVRYNQNGMGSQQIGRQMPLLYLASDPRGSAIIATFWSMWSLTILPLIPGLAAIALAMMGAIVGVKPGRF